MDTSRFSIQKTTAESTTFSTVSLSPNEVADALQAHPDLRSATRAGLFSPVTATPNDTVAVEVKVDGSAVIIVQAIATPTVTITATDTANSSS